MHFMNVESYPVSPSRQVKLLVYVNYSKSILGLILEKAIQISSSTFRRHQLLFFILFTIMAKIQNLLNFI